MIVPKLVAACVTLIALVVAQGPGDSGGARPIDDGGLIAREPTQQPNCRQFDSKFACMVRAKQSARTCTLLLAASARCTIRRPPCRRAHAGEDRGWHASQNNRLINSILWPFIVWFFFLFSSFPFSLPKTLINLHLLFAARYSLLTNLGCSSHVSGTRSQVRIPHRKYRW